MILYLRSIQFIPVNSGTIGHFVLDSEKVILNIEQMRMQGTLISPILVLEPRISNLYFVQILRRAGFRVVPNFPSSFIHAVLKKMFRYYRWRTKVLMDKSPLLVSDLHDRKPLHEFSEREISVGENFLNRLGVNSEDKIACCVFRDFGYDIAMNEIDYELKQGYRITPLSYFKPVVSLLLDLDFKVIRMGRHNKDRLQIDSANFVDISDHPSENSDFLDFYIFARSAFTFSTGSGIDALATFFRKPTCFLNITYAHPIPNSKLWPVILLCDYLNETDSSRVPVNEVLSDKFTNIWHGQISDLGIRLLPKEPKQILKAAKIFLYKINRSSVNKKLTKSKDFDVISNILY